MLPISNFDESEFTKRIVGALEMLTISANLGNDLILVLM